MSRAKIRKSPDMAMEAGPGMIYRPELLLKPF
jgi:hypothetical protein